MSEELSKYERGCLIYQAHKQDAWDAWLEFVRTFEKPGKQGLVGLMRLKGAHDCIFKISQYINYLVQHESVVMQGLGELALYCPHFCRSIGAIECDVNPRCRRDGNPFNTDCTYTIKKDVLLCEHIDESYKFSRYIKAVNKVPESVLYSVIKQVLMAIHIAQLKKRFSHYDLHSNNIMVRRCNRDIVFMYVLDDDNQFCVPTLGFYPTIIDFGFSYIDDMEDGPLWASMAHTDVGFMSDRFDWVADPKLFLVTVSSEIKDQRESKRASALRRIVKNTFNPLCIDWHSGWDRCHDKGASDQISRMLMKHTTASSLFTEYNHYCLDMIQSLIILPLGPQNHTDFSVSYTSFLNEWVKIENEISSPFHNLYILKGVVDSVRGLQSKYVRSASRSEAVAAFKADILQRVDEVAKFCRPKNLNYEKMMCAIILFSRHMEGLLHDIVSRRMSRKRAAYDELPVDSVAQIYGLVEMKIPDEYTYNENTVVYIMDSHHETRGVFHIPPDALPAVNDMHPITRGTYIYDMFLASQRPASPPNNTG